ncbi:imidazolonepropionase [bacterium]|nr:imidazolonepropionase [bacterium]
MKTDLLIRNARQVVTFDQGQFKTFENVSVACAGSKIIHVGDEKQLGLESATVIDASDFVVLPGLIDSHTHTIFAGSREDEFEMKLRGATYAEIAQKGGGILNTMSATRKTSKEELLQLGKKRLVQALRFGITTIEIKSGYGLSLADEIKILEVIRDLREHTPMDIHATFLGAHSVPPEYKPKRDDYVKLVCDEMIPAVAEKKLAEFCDAFCEANVFTIDETRRIFEAAEQYGLKLKLHADQLTHTGGAELCAEMGAVSADHLEHISDRGIDALKNSKTVAGLLPGCSFFLNMQYPPARKLIEAGIPVALATDFNPGSSMTQHLQLIMSIACTQMKMSPAEVIQGVTLNAAKSLDRTDIGNIQPGCKADLVLFSVPNYKYIPYHFGQNHVEHVIKNGRMVF